MTQNGSPTKRLRQKSPASMASPARHLPAPSPQHDRALVIKPKWLDLILSGRKTWEIRGKRTNVRGVVALAQSGTGHLVGEATVTNCFELQLADMPNHVDKHCIQDLSIVKYDQIFAWELRNAKRFLEPKCYEHKQGAVIWVKL